MATIEFSEFSDGGTAQSGDVFVGLKDGSNAKFTFPSIIDVQWQVVSTNTDLEANNGYFVDSMGMITLSVPASLSAGDLFEVAMVNSGNFVIQMNSGQTLRVGGSVSSAAGTLTSSSNGDAIRFVAYSSTDLVVMSCITHNFTLT